ncbi:AzlC family ABC transporter permease [Acinetobacter sp. SAAs470]|nr:MULTISPECIES: AzlC family ABC transporter permease [unclassified Acinetobacter]WOE33210.1 AzlC family ABC transporter permease [Acinetobacter sp. SAAs470]WOE39870.1 AzlC family ABC transporter permease [Acinetobacter sp. SAAs474]
MNFKHRPSQHSSARLNFLYGVRDMLPLSLAVIPWAVLAGMLAINAGLTMTQAIAMSVFIFAGTAQLVSLSLYMAGASAITILCMVFFITTQHFIYALSLRSDIQHLPMIKRLSLGFLLTDELYAMSELYPERQYVYLLGAGLSFYLFWVIFSLFGILFTATLGQFLSIYLDYSIVAIFLVMAILLIKNRYTLIAVLISATFSLIFKSLDIQFGIVLASIMGMLIAAVIEQKGSK